MTDTKLQTDNVSHLGVSEAFSSSFSVGRSSEKQNVGDEGTKLALADGDSSRTEEIVANSTDSPARQTGGGTETEATKSNSTNQFESNGITAPTNGELLSQSLVAVAPSRPQLEEEEGRTQILPETQNDEAPEPSSSSSKQRNDKVKKDRSKLRKGKWTVEEEEYTSRIIHHFSTGLLSLPEGTTLRSYLAQKLNCDPMRITKKYAGASCLGKRVYHLCDRSPATITDIEMAKAELAQLEHRFRLRIEHGQNGLPLLPPADVMPALSNGATNIFAPHRHTASAAASSWLQSFVMAAGAGTGTGAPTAAPMAAAQQAPFPATSASSWAIQAPAPSQWLPISSSSIGTAPAVPSVTPAPAPSNDAIAALAWAQAAAALTPALSQLAAANIQQHQQQLQNAFQAQLKACSPPIQATPSSIAPPSQFLYPAKPPAPSTTGSGNQVVPQHIAPVRHSPTPSKSFDKQSPKRPMPPSQVTKPASKKLKTDNRSKEDEDAGSMLMGFLTSLRQNYEEALEERKNEEGPVRNTGGTESALTNKASSTTRLSRAALVQASAQASENGDSMFESSSGHTSLEDTESSASDQNVMLIKASKKVDLSSSEESDREQILFRGPPRKRHKRKGVVGEFTSKNVAMHNDRMNAIHGTAARRTIAEDETNALVARIERAKEQKLQE